MDVYSIEFKNNTCKISDFGAQIISCIIQGEEMLFLSKKAVFDCSKPIRGGIPIIFPVFGDSKYPNMPKHGFARTSKWILHSSNLTDDYQEITFKLESNTETKTMWKYDFILYYHVRLRIDSLETNLEIHNKSEGILPFECLFHNYFGVHDVSNIEIGGLPIHYYNQLTGRMEDKFRLTNIIDEEVDKIFDESTMCVTLDTKYMIHAYYNKNMHVNCVLWNPWVEKSKLLNDFGDTEYKKMVCIEPGVLNTHNKLTYCKPDEVCNFTQIIIKTDRKVSHI